MAQDILTESFDPIVELTTGADLMMAMVYAQELGDWDYSGMYTAVLKFKVSLLDFAACISAEDLLLEAFVLQAWK